MTISIALSDDIGDAHASVGDVIVYDGQRRSYIALQLGDDITILMPGVESTSAEYARSIATQLVRAADEAEAATRNAEPVASPDETGHEEVAREFIERGDPVGF